MPTSNLRELEIGSVITVDNDYYRDIYVTPVSAGGEKTGNLTVVMNHRRDPFVLHNLAYSRYTVDNNRPRTSFMYARDATHPSLWTKTLVKAGGYVQLADDYQGVINGTNDNLHLILRGTDERADDVDITVTLPHGGAYTLTTLAAHIQAELRNEGSFAAGNAAEAGLPLIQVTGVTTPSDDPNYNKLKWVVTGHADATETFNIQIGENTTCTEILGLYEHPTLFSDAGLVSPLTYHAKAVPFTTARYDGYAAIVQIKPSSDPDEFIMAAPSLDGIEVGSSVTLYNCSASRECRVRINEQTGGDVGDFNTTKGGAGYFYGIGNHDDDAEATYYIEGNAAATRLLLGVEERVTLVHYRDEISTPSKSYWLITSTTVSTLPAVGV